MQSPSDPASAPLWIFAYGSLIWNPEFPVAARALAELSGWRRSFCMWSIHHRGTPEAPGLVLALDAEAGACCTGVAFRVADGQEGATLAALRARELVSSAYREVELTVRLADGSAVSARTFVVDRAHDQYCGGLPSAEQARVIARATGGRGRNADYLRATAEHLAALGIPDPELESLAREVRAILGE
jgi:cation transport protein ChaC